MERLQDSVDLYRGGLNLQRDRLALSEWLASLAKSNRSCPVCGGTLQNVGEELYQLTEALRGIEGTADRYKPVPQAFTRELLRARTELRRLTERLEAVRGRKRALESRSEELRRTSQRSRDIDRFLGKVEQALIVFDRLGTNEDLARELGDLRSRVNALKSKVAEGQLRAREERALKIVASLAGEILPHLDAENADYPIALSVKDLTVKVLGPDREDYLFEIGSGANWLSYHLAVTLGLQQFFLTLPENPVPGLLIYDQPSQVYFPRRLKPADDEDLDPRLTRDEDVRAVRRAFEAMGRVVHQAQGRLQVIVLDHAGASVWGGLPEITLVEDWRDGPKLIPESWLESPP